MKKNPSIFFYLPSKKIVRDVNEDITLYWNWISRIIKTHPAMPIDSKNPVTLLGPYNWTLQTYIYLKSSNINCQVVDHLNVDGILFSHSDFLPRFIEPISSRYIVEIKPDRSLKCLFANFIITQNPYDPLIKSLKRFFINAASVPYWPQPSIIKRDANRGKKIENVCYMGNPQQFISQVELLRKEINNLGMRFLIKPRLYWNDYSDVDLIVAVRPETCFEATKLPPYLSLQRKPASKLINAWLAGVPAIVSPDPAFLDLKKNSYDFLLAKNVSEILKQLKSLKTNPLLYGKMISNSKKRAANLSVDYTIKQWQTIINNKIIPDFYLWKTNRYKRLLAIIMRTIYYPKLLRYFIG